MCLHCHWVWEEPACLPFAFDEELGGTNCGCYSVHYDYNETLGKHIPSWVILCARPVSLLLSDTLYPSYKNQRQSLNIIITDEAGQQQKTTSYFPESFDYTGRCQGVSISKVVKKDVPIIQYT